MGFPGTGTRQFNDPEGIGINLTNGHVYVADNENDRIQEFTSSGSFVRQWVEYGISTVQTAPADSTLNPSQIEKLDPFVSNFQNN